MIATITLDPDELIVRMKPLSDQARWAFLHFQLAAWSRGVKRGWPSLVDEVAADMRITPRAIPNCLREMLAAGLVEWTEEGIIPIGQREQLKVIDAKREKWRQKYLAQKVKQRAAQRKGAVLTEDLRPGLQPYADAWREILGTDMPTGPITNAVFKRFASRVRTAPEAKTMAAFRNYLQITRDRGKVARLVEFTTRWKQWVPRRKALDMQSAAPYTSACATQDAPDEVLPMRLRDLGDRRSDPAPGEDQGQRIAARDSQTAEDLSELRV